MPTAFPVLDSVNHFSFYKSEELDINEINLLAPLPSPQGSQMTIVWVPEDHAEAGPSSDSCLTRIQPVIHKLSSSPLFYQQGSAEFSGRVRSTSKFSAK